MPGEFSSKRHVLFDLDGTLVDSSAMHARAFVETLQPRHPGLAAAFRYPDHQGRPTLEVFRSLGVTDPAELSVLTRHKQQLYRDAVAAGRIAVFPGVPELLQRLHDAGRRLFIVTGASRDSTGRVLAAARLARFFAGITTADDVSPGKPAPGPYRHTLTRHRLAAADSLAVEDAASGVASAGAAGLTTVLVNTDLQLPGIRNVGPIARLGPMLLS
jgi:HAD superfamily hydrolase (TIGR01509 family)